MLFDRISLPQLFEIESIDLATETFQIYLCGAKVRAVKVSFVREAQKELLVAGIAAETASETIS